MTFGERLALARKQLKLSQSAFGKKVDIHPSMLGKYERGDMTPSVLVAAKLAKALNVSLDYLTGLDTDTPIDNTTLQTIREIERLPVEIKEHLFFVLQSVIRDTKVQAAYRG